MDRIVRTAMLVGAMAFAAGASEASAQVNFSIGGGPSFAMGDIGDALDMGYHGQASLGFGIAMLPFGLQADLGYNSFGITDTDENMDVIHGALNAVINLPTPGLSPYIIGGLGYYRMSVGDLDNNDFGVNVGAGIRLGLPGLGVFAEGRFHNIFTEGESTRFIPITVGVRL